MRISDWSSDVCSSDLGGFFLERADDHVEEQRHEEDRQEGTGECAADHAGTDRVLAAAARAGGDGERDHAHDEGERGHDDRAQSHACRHHRSEEHTSELQSLMRISYAVFCLKKTQNTTHQHRPLNTAYTTPTHKS